MLQSYKGTNCLLNELVTLPINQQGRHFNKYWETEVHSDNLASPEWPSSGQGQCSMTVSAMKGKKNNWIFKQSSWSGSSWWPSNNNCSKKEMTKKLNCNKMLNFCKTSKKTFVLFWQMQYKWTLKDFIFGCFFLLFYFIPHSFIPVFFKKLLPSWRWLTETLFN